MNLLLKNILIVSPSDKINKRSDLLIINGTINKIQNDISIEEFENIEVIEGSNLTCVPGLFDMHVHFREPGQTEKEDLISGSNSAMNGGFTGVLCMPNTKPPLDSKKIIESLRNKSEGFLTDIYFSGCITENREGQRIIPRISELIRAGIRAFTDDGDPVNDEDIMKKILNISSEFEIPVLQHCEDPELMKDGVINEGVISEKLEIKGIPAFSEITVIEKDVNNAIQINGSRYHVQHISCGDGIEIISNGKIANQSITCEVCPHHFILTDESIELLGTNAKMNPPLRTREDIEKIKKGLAEDVIDVICTDHAPHTELEKERGINDAPFGIIGLETCIGLTYTHLVKDGIISFEKMIEKMSINPRKILGLSLVHIKEGEDANLTILNENEEWIIDKNKFLSKSRNTPFDSFKVICKPFAAINNNKIHYCKL
jgi:dihydroorotase